VDNALRVLSRNGFCRLIKKQANRRLTGFFHKTGVKTVVVLHVENPANPDSPRFSTGFTE
jgi:hypothetical protein